MASKKLGNLIKKARTDAGMTQEQLARKVKGATATDISAAERGVGDLTTDQLKAIAKATGVTQASLLDVGKSSSAKTAAKKTSAKKKTTTNTTGTGMMKLTATEKKFIAAYRDANADTRKAALAVLQGEGADITTIITQVMAAKGKKPSSSSSSGKKSEDLLSTLLGKGVSSVLGQSLGKRELPAEE